MKNLRKALRWLVALWKGSGISTAKSGLRIVPVVEFSAEVVGRVSIFWLRSVAEINMPFKRRYLNRKAIWESEYLSLITPEMEATREQYVAFWREDAKRKDAEESKRKTDWEKEFHVKAVKAAAAQSENI